MSIFLPSYKHNELHISRIGEFIVSSFSIPQQEVIPIGKNVYLHYMYQIIKTPTRPFYDAPGDFIIYKTTQDAIVICIYDLTMLHEQRRIFRFDISPNGRKIVHKGVTYITDKVEAQKLEKYNNKRHTIVAYGKSTIDNRMQYNLFGYHFTNTHSGNIFKMSFITSTSSQYFNKQDMENVRIVEDACQF